ncbi:T9SS type A sorting domain-containing protein [bacterium]|nr:T9SS type A sorting domain-containing protein [bacterium]
MKKIICMMLMLTAILITNSLVAEVLEPCDVCTNQLIALQIYNDPYYQGGSLVSPSSTSDDLSCCPGMLADGEVAHRDFPDTLAFGNTIDSLITLFSSDTIVPYSTSATWWHQDLFPGTSIEVPPQVQECCCVDGIFWKAKMFDDATSTWSEWTDVHQAGQGNTSFGTILVAAISTGAFKQPGYGGNMSFECNVDSVAIYVWDCANEPGMEGTLGEFAAKVATYPDNSSMGLDTLILRRWAIPTGIDENPKLPREYFISQNTPNPFNATTAIQYGLPEEAEVRVDVTNLLGQRVATLVDERQSAGFKRLIWDGRDNVGHELPSGVYFYQIKANSFIDKKRAILMK